MNAPQELINLHFDDKYFDAVDARKEARLLFFEQNRILERLSPGTPFHIGETGFGAGRLVASLFAYLEEMKIRGVEIHYHSVELHPVTPEKMGLLLEGFRSCMGEQIDAIRNAYAGLDFGRHGLQRREFSRDFGRFTLDIWFGEALEMIDSLEEPCDAWFLDGHGPKKNPSIWRREVLEAVGRKTKPGGTFATFTVAGEIRRGLASAGFSVERVAGFGGKNKVLRGIMPTESVVTSGTGREDSRQDES